MIEIAGAHRMRVQFDAAKVRDPGKPSRVIDYDFLSSSAGRERQGDRTQPGRPFLWRALLIERLRLRVVDETLENNWPVASASERTRRDGEIVLNKVELGDFYPRRKV